jgi:hypothetical protein
MRIRAIDVKRGLHVGVPLVLGAAVYAAFGRDVLFLRILHLSRAGLALPPAARWIVQHLPDAAWGYAVGAFVALVWARGARAWRWGWLAAGSAVVAGFEIGQALQVVPGTFDLVDLCVSLGGYWLAVVLLPRWRPQAAGERGT